jgi:hypothetical protein
MTTVAELTEKFGNYRKLLPKSPLALPFFSSTCFSSRVALETVNANLDFPELNGNFRIQRLAKKTHGNYQMDILQLKAFVDYRCANSKWGVWIVKVGDQTGVMVKEPTVPHALTVDDDINARSAMLKKMVYYDAEMQKQEHAFLLELAENTARQTKCTLFMLPFVVTNKEFSPDSTDGKIKGTPLNFFRVEKKHRRADGSEADLSTTLYEKTWIATIEGTKKMIERPVSAAETDELNEMFGGMNP